MRYIILLILTVYPYWAIAQIDMSVNSIKNINRTHLAFAIEINVYNQGNDTITFKKQNESIFGPVLHDSESENTFEGLGIFLFSNTFDLIKDIKSDIGVADFVFFDKNGKLRFLYLEGVDNPKVLTKRINYYHKNRINISEDIKIPPNDKRAFIIYVYIGKKKYIPNNLKYIKFYYKQDEKISNTNYYEIAQSRNTSSIHLEQMQLNSFMTPIASNIGFKAILQ